MHKKARVNCSVVVDWCRIYADSAAIDLADTDITFRSCDITGILEK